VYYPSLFTDEEQVRIRDEQCEYPGSIFAIELTGGKPAAFDFLRRVRIARNAVSLGGVETLCCHPATTTHSELSEQEQAESGVTPGLVRVSIGVEDYRDLLADFKRALDAVP
jgi:cystathionine beta-lyase/cystathionine gamma-synthase